MTIGLTLILIAALGLCFLRRRRTPSDEQLLDQKRRYYADHWHPNP
jgi:hypothetical protein